MACERSHVMEAPASCDSGNRFDPAEYYPDGYKPELLEKWPVEGDLVVPREDLPDTLKRSMGDAGRHKQQNQQILREEGRRSILTFE